MDFAIILSALKPYHHIEPTSSPAPLLHQTERRLRAHAPIEGDAPYDFVAVDFDAPGDTRSRRFQKHAWRTIGPIYALHAYFDDERWLRLARHYAEHWIEASERAPEPGEGAEIEGINHFAWYDMAVGLRASRLAYLLDRLARARGRDEALIDRFARMLSRHLDFLADEASFARHSNHGMFQALGYLSACRRFPETPWIAGHAPRAEAMFAEMIAQQFHPDGVHREHSPGYHDYFVHLFHSALMDGLLTAADFPQGLLEAAEQALFWMVTPDGRLLALGDTNPRRAGGGLWRIEGERERAFVDRLRTGWRRRRDELGGKLYEHAGLAFFRSRGAGRARSYLAFNAGFHSRVHKQADDLSMVWFEGRDAILADPGSYGYFGRTEPGSDLHDAGFWYADPKRIYVESTGAHNCVEIDGRSHQRREVSPYGSAITRFRAGRRLHMVRARLRYLPGDVRHTRTLILRPGRWLIVLDRLSGGHEHRYAQCFKLGRTCRVVCEGLPPEAEGRAVHISQFLERGAPSLARGQREPELRGWVSERYGGLSPAPSLRFDHAPGKAARIGTILSVDASARVIAHELDEKLARGWIDVESEDGVERITLALGHGKVALGPRP